MNLSDVKKILKHPNIVIVLTALSYVNLTDKELDILILRHLRGHTQEAVALEMDCSVNGVQNIEKSALEKCGKVWKDLSFIKTVKD